MQYEPLTTIGVLGIWIGVPFSLLWAMGALTRHLRNRRLGPTPYWWQREKSGSASRRPMRSKARHSFWADLKEMATKPYGRKSVLEKAYGACVLLFALAAMPMPYEYYFSLRMAVCVALYFFAAAAYRTRPEHQGWLATSALLMVLYNPIVPFHVGVQLVWTVINAATVYVLYRAKRALDRPSAEPSEIAP